jgi:protein phosphatase
MLVDRGEITEAEAARHPQKNIILRSVSAAGDPAIIETKWLTDIEDGDHLLLCTDGVLEQMNDDRFRTVLGKEDSAQREMFMKYCHGLTGDNFSLYLLKLKTDTQQVISDLKKTNRKLILAISASSFF